MASFKVPCPSCEHQVLISNPSLVGTKVECPKCKYRFKVEEPAGGIPKDDPKAEKGKKKKTEAAGGAKKKSNKKVVGIVVGVLAVVLLGVVGATVMGGKKTPQTAGGGGGKTFGSGGGGGGGGTAGDGTDSAGDAKDKEKDPPKPKNPNPISDKDERATTNLLPAQTVALHRLDIGKLRQTPLAMMFDPAMLEMFRSSFGFDAADVGVYYHAFVGSTRDPYGVMYLREPVSDKEVLARMPLADAGKGKKIKSRTLYTFRTNPFINGVANAFSFGSLFSDLYEKIPAGPKTPATRVYGVCVYDSQHVIVGDYKLLERFLDSLDEKGFPKFGDQYAENQMYLTIDSKLKRVLKDLGSESGEPPAALYAEQLVPGMYDPKLFKSDFQPIGVVLDPVLNRAQYAAAALTSFTTKGVAGTVKLVMVSDTAALEVVKEQLTPGLTTVTQALTLFLNTPVMFRNLNAAAPTSPLGPGGTGGGPATPGIPPGIPPGFPPGGMGGSGMGPPGGVGPPPPPPAGSSGSSASPQMPPTLPGSGGYTGPGTGFPPATGFPPSTGNQPHDSNLPPSFVGLGVTDQNITIAIELNWSDETYRRLLAPQMLGMANVVKGKMAVFASEVSYTALAAAVVRMTEATKRFPRGAAARKMADASRMGLQYPPQTRVSLFAEMLPYMGRGALAAWVDRDAEWFNESNMAAAEAWVPELLVPTYPQSAWRATSRFVADGRVLGGTNYVAIAGVGRDAARYDPTNPAHAKKVGLVGYDWGSDITKDVPDKPEYTIFLMQTPPGLSQPWLAGGGATVRGLDETDPMHGFRHTFGTPGGKPGTFAIMGDGSVRFIPGDIDPKILLAMATRAGGEDISAVIDKAAPLVSSPKKKEAELKTDPKPDAGPADPKPADPKPADPKSDPSAKSDSAPEPREKK